MAECGGAGGTEGQEGGKGAAGRKRGGDDSSAAGTDHKKMSFIAHRR